MTQEESLRKFDSIESEYFAILNSLRNIDESAPLQTSQFSIDNARFVAEHLAALQEAMAMVIKGYSELEHE